MSEQIERARKRGSLSEKEREKCECGEKWRGEVECKRREREGKEEFGLEER